MSDHSMTATQKKRKNVDFLKYIWQNFNYIIIFICILTAFLFVNGKDTSITSVTNIFLHSAILGTIALGMGMVVLIGDIDLSVGSSFVFIGGLTIVFYNTNGNLLLTLVCAILIGAFCGIINGILIGKWKMPAFIVTLATMLIYRSVSQYMMNEMGETRYRIDASQTSYQTLFQFGNGKILNIGHIVLAFWFLAAVMIYLTTATKFGKKIYAIGSNERAARLAGVNVDLTKIIVFILCGVLVGLASFLKIAKDTSFDPATSGSNFELYCIAAVVIGGISMAGGKGRLAGVIFGTMSFTLIDKIITALGMNALLNDTVKGVILLAAVGLQMVKKQSSE